MRGKLDRRMWRQIHSIFCFLAAKSVLEYGLCSSLSIVSSEFIATTLSTPSTKYLTLDAEKCNIYAGKLGFLIPACVLCIQVIASVQLYVSGPFYGHIISYLFLALTESGGCMLFCCSTAMMVSGSCHRHPISSLYRTQKHF